MVPQNRKEQRVQFVNIGGRKKMKIVYIAAQFPPNNQFVVDKSKVMPQYAADYVSRLIHNGFSYQEGVELEVINLLPIAAFPKGSSAWKIPAISWDEEGKHVDGIPYCNIFGIRQYSKYINLKRKVEKKIKLWNAEKVCVVVYGMSLPVLRLLKYIKKNSQNIKTCLLIPDLPQYMNMDGSFLYHFLKKIDTKRQMSLIKYTDGKIYFSKYMNDFFKTPNDQWTVFEGAVEYKKVQSELVPLKEKQNKKIILYSGSIEKAYGIEDLLNAFMKIGKDNYELWIIGAGNATELVRKQQKCDIRIKYLGSMPHKEVIELQKKATVLVNPRRPDGVFTRYSFPSKTLEYMMAGVPVIMHKLPGVPDEYDKFLEYFSSTESEQMAHEIELLCEKNSKWLWQRGYEAREFVAEEKNNKRQLQKICKFIAEL